MLFKQYISLKSLTLRNTKIQTRLIASFVLLSFIPLLFTSIMVYDISTRAIQKKSSALSEQLLKQMSLNIQSEINKINSLSDELSFNQQIQQGLDSYSQMEPGEKSVFRQSVVKTMTSKILAQSSIKYAGIIIGTDPLDIDAYKGKYFNIERIISFGSMPDYSSGKFKNILSDIEKTDTPPSWDIYSEKNNSEMKCISLVKGINSMIISTKKIASMVFLIDENYLSDLYREILEKNILGEASDILIINKNGVVISSLNSHDKSGNAYENEKIVSSVCKQTESGNFMLDGDMITYSAVEGTDWFLVGILSRSYLNGESSSLRNKMVSTSLICLVLAILFAFIIANSISRPLKLLDKRMLSAKEGDLCTSLTDNSKDEIGSVIRNFNSMIQNIGLLIQKVYITIHKVMDYAEKLSMSSEQACYSSEQTASIVDQISQGTMQQAEEAALCFTQMDNLSKDINSVALETENVKQLVIKSKDLRVATLTAIDTLTGKAAETGEASGKIIENIHSLNEDMNKIENIIKLISNITEQTKLLSLNASIQAAHAGAAGKSFAVVATEIKKLAQQSKEASTLVAGFIRKIHDKTLLAFEEANYTGKIVNQQLSAVARTDEVFKNMNEIMGFIEGSMNNVATAVETSLGSKEKTLSSIENISAVSQETASSIEEVSAGTQQQIADAEELKTLAKGLKVMADELENATSVFNTQTVENVYP